MERDIEVTDVIEEIIKQFEEFDPSVRYIPNDSRFDTYDIIITKYIIFSLFGIVGFIEKIDVYDGEKDNHSVDLDKIRESDEKCKLEYGRKCYLENDDMKGYEHYDHHIKLTVDFNDKKYKNMSLSEIIQYLKLNSVLIR